MSDTSIYDIKTQARFCAKIKISSSGCWEWQASLSPNGYGKFVLSTKNNRYAHRISYQMLIGNIPDGLDLDHLCRNRKCVNPQHLEPVTRKTNVRRGIAGAVNGARQLAITHCPRGHEYTEENIIRGRNNSRSCRTCVRISERSKTRIRIRKK